MSAASVHPTAGKGFDTAAEIYQRARPGYPAAVVDHLVASLSGGPSAAGGAPVADIAAGTGKLTTALVDRGIDVVAVEPVAGMYRALRGALPAGRVVAATAESLPIANGSLSGATVAQAFHWFDPAVATAELARCIRPGGTLAVLWNVRDERVDWVKRLTSIIDPYETDGKRVPRFRDRAWRAGFDRGGPFQDVEVVEVEHSQEMDEDGLCDRVASTSFVAVLDDDVRARVMDEVRDLARRHPDLRSQGVFPFPYVCELHLMRRVL